MKFTTTPLPILLFTSICSLFPTSVQAHGYVESVSIAGKEYTGWLPFTMPYSSPVGKSIVRNVPDDGPILDITSSDLACNKGGEKGAALIADANAGDIVKLTMNTWPADHVGPVTVYMANCGGDCKSFDPTSKGKVWFKIDEDGMTNSVWGTLKLISQGNSWSVTIPKSIKAGQYLLRFEILALHSAREPQFYPSCTQLNIKSSGSSTPSSNDLVDIPGIYSSSTGKAIYGDVWSGTPKSWPVAGPAVVSWASGTGFGGGGGEKSQTQQTSTSKTTASPTQSNTSIPPLTTTTAQHSKTATEPEIASTMSAPMNVLPPGANKPTGTSSSIPSPSSSGGPKKCKPKNKRRSTSDHADARREYASTLNRLRKEAKRSANVASAEINVRNQTPAIDLVPVHPKKVDSEGKGELDTIVAYERPKRHNNPSNVLKNKRGATGIRV